MQGLNEYELIKNLINKIQRYNSDIYVVQETHLRGRKLRNWKTICYN